MEKQNSDRPPCFWRIENTQKKGTNAHWHNLKFHISYNGEEANEETSWIYDSGTFKEEDYWMSIGKKISELMDTIELANRLRKVKPKT